MDVVTWRRRFVHDMLFSIEGSGWHPPELRDAVGYRWSGPGHFSVLRVPLAEDTAGRGEAHLALVDPEPIPEVAIFLNGHRLAVTPRRLGAMAVLDFAWDAAAMAGEGRAEFWFHAATLQHLPAPMQGMRGVGFRLSSLVLELRPDGPAPAAEALALIAGRRVLDDRLPVTPGRARMAFLSDGAARMLDMRLEAARLGPTAKPHLACALRAEAEALDLALAAPGVPALRAEMSEAGDLRLPDGLTPRDGLLFARLLAALPGAYAAWLDEAMVRAAPDAALLAAWRRSLARLAMAAQGSLAAALADGPDPFAVDPATPFAWPGGD
ncbi:hypothetical protein AAFN86_13295 [Roseomonas sp. CAU 1739]|uniref:hypothetical protein n=1 Tax=Roseomonas sp. CAU 1739 TaxID=3140364 RepID=UPI00325BCC9D